MSVKGGEVVAGGAPLDLIIDKVQIVQSLFYRTAEHLKSLPLRKKGPPSKDIQEGCRPWLFQSVPGSYPVLRSDPKAAAAGDVSDWRPGAASVDRDVLVDPKGRGRGSGTFS